MPPLLRRNRPYQLLQDWREDCRPQGMRVDVALGRALAHIAHPHAAWRLSRRRGRIFLVGSYFGVGYVGALLLLMTF